jgi:hypothetical protein
MTTDSTTSSVDDGIHSMLSSSKDKAVACLEKWEDCVKQKPVQAIAGALVAGILIHRLPIRSILIAKIKIISALAPPALLAYGAAKVVEILQQKSANAARIAEAERIAENPRGERFQP